MRIFLIIVAVHILLIIAAVAGIGWWGWSTYRAPGPLTTVQIIDIPRGYGGSLIADKLESAGVIAHPLLFKIMARLHEKETAMKAGEYEIPAGASMQAVMALLESGAVVQHKFTIPEGLTSWQIVQLLNAQDNLKGGITAIPAEGTLLPETYHYMRGEPRAAKLRQMQEAMTKTLDELWPGRADNLPYKTKEEALVMASIIEKETGIGGERATIAGVFVNRLRKGMALQTDPTVIYALTKGQIEDKGKGPLGRRLLLKDLEIDSPYNTYKYPGLPPAPIANPGRAALEAALHPEDNDYFYFVADGSGGHVFAKTLTEHNRNVARWRKIRKNK